MNGKKIGKGLIKGTLWGAVAYSTYVFGTGVAKVGEGMSGIPFWAPLSLPVILAGNIIKAATIVPGIGVVLNTAEAVVEFIPEKKENK